MRFREVGVDLSAGLEGLGRLLPLAQRPVQGATQAIGAVASPMPGNHTVDRFPRLLEPELALLLRRMTADHGRDLRPGVALQRRDRVGSISSPFWKSSIAARMSLPSRSPAHSARPMMA